MTLTEFLDRVRIWLALYAQTSTAQPDRVIDIEELKIENSLNWQEQLRANFAELQMIAELEHLKSAARLRMAIELTQTGGDLALSELADILKAIMSELLIGEGENEPSS